jgi:hypothetical protein
VLQQIEHLPSTAPGRAQAIAHVQRVIETYETMIARKRRADQA